MESTVFDFVEFMVFSCFDYISIFLLAFTLFRFFDYRDYIPKMILVSLLLAFIDHELRTVYDLAAFSVFLQMILWTVFFWLLFRIHVFYSAVMAATSNVLYFTLQSAIIFLLEWTGLLNRQELAGLVPMADLLPTISLVCVIVITWIFRKKNWGFSFVPDDPYARVKIDAENIAFLVCVLIAFISYALLISLFFKGVTTVSINTAVAIIVTIPLVYYAVRKDRQQ